MEDKLAPLHEIFEDYVLKDYGLAALGTLKKNKAEIPPAFSNAQDREILSSIFGFQKKCTLVSYTCIPKKNTVVLLISTMHHNGKKDSGDAKKPEMIIDYNRSKCSVDVVDELRGRMSITNLPPFIKTKIKFIILMKIVILSFLVPLDLVRNHPLLVVEKPQCLFASVVTKK